MSKSEAKRGRAGEGVYFDKMSQTWAFRVVKDKNYKRRGFDTKTEAKKARVLFVLELEKKAAEAAKPKEWTLDEVFEEYKTSGMSRIRKNTAENRISLYRADVAPVFGSQKIEAIKPQDISAFYLKLLSDGKCRGTVNQIHQCIRALYTFSLDRGFVSESVYVDMCESKYKRAHLPAKTEDEKFEEAQPPKIYTKAQIDSMREILEGKPHLLPFEIACRTGLRPREVLGLVWDDIDFERKTLEVWKQIDEDTGSIEPPKKAASYRTVPLSSSIISILKEAKEAQEAAQMSPVEVIDNTARAKVKGQRVEMMFICRREDGTLLTYDSMRRLDDKFESVGIVDEWKMHYLRHTFLSELAGRGCPVIELKRIAGHKDISTTQRFYISGTESTEAQALKALEAI